MDDALAELCRLVQKIGGGRVKGETRLWHDLHIGGDDAFELLELISDKFRTSFATLPFTDYFPEEPDALAAHLATTLGLGRGRQPVTVQHLAEVVQRGEWFDPPTV